MARKVHLPLEVIEEVAAIKQKAIEARTPFWITDRVIELYYTWLDPTHPRDLIYKINGAKACAKCQKTIRRKWEKWIS